MSGLLFELAVPESAAVVGHVAEDAADQETAVVVMGVVADTRSVVVDTAAG